MKKALLIIDVQNDYFTGGKCELHRPEQALKAIKSLLDQSRKNGIPIFYVQHVNDQYAALFNLDTWGSAIHDDISPIKGESVIIKHEPNSFYGTQLHEQLQTNDIQELIICGMMTHMCIDTTVRAAKSLNYSITLAADACACKDLYWDGQLLRAQTVQQVYMSSLAGKFASIRQSFEIFK